MILNGIIHFPMNGEEKISFCLKGAKLSEDKNFWEINLKMLNASKKLKSLIGNYAFQFCNCKNLEEIKQRNLLISTTRNSIKFGFVSSDDEYKQVLSLRKIAYSKEGKVPENILDEEMGDEFDKRSLILIGKHRDKVVASLRLIYHKSEDKMEHELFFKLPEKFPPRVDILEVTRVCTLPEFRKSDLVMNLFRHCAIANALTQKRWIIGSSTKKLFPLYQRLGFKSTGIIYKHQSLGNQEHIFFIGDSHKVLSGSEINPISWNVIYREVSKFVREKELIKFDKISEINYLIYEKISPVSSLIFEKLIKK